jgi:hypothetical protein
MARPEITTEIIQAYNLYQKRQAGDYQARPHGRCDNGGRWFPSDDEWQECCRTIRRPSRAFPWNLYKHAFSAEHIAHLAGVEPRALRSLIARQRPARTAPDICTICYVPGCEHERRAELERNGLQPIPPHRAEMSRHLGQAS